MSKKIFSKNNFLKNISKLINNNSPLEEYPLGGGGGIHPPHLASEPPLKRGIKIPKNKLSITKIKLEKLSTKFKNMIIKNKNKIFKTINFSSYEIKLPSINFYFKVLKNVSVSVFVLMMIFGQMFLSANMAQAATYTFNQTDWSGGVLGTTLQPTGGVIGGVPPTTTNYSAKDAATTAAASGVTLGAGSLQTLTQTGSGTTVNGFNDNVGGTPQFSGTSVNGSSVTLNNVPAGQPVWSQMTSTPGSLTYGSSLAYDSSNNYIYVTQGGSTAFYRYSITSNLWTSMAVTPGAMGPGGTTFYPGSGNYIYATQGNSATFYKYSISGNSWTTLATMPGSIGGGSSLTYDSSGNNLYVTAGGNTTAFYKYSISGNTWTTITAVPGIVGYGGSSVYPGSGDYIYATQGNGTTFYQYSISGNSWTTLASAPVSMAGGDTLVYPGSGNYIYSTVGGSAAAYYRYSISGNSWTAMTSAPGIVTYGGSGIYPGSGNYIYTTQGGSAAFYRYNIAADAAGGWSSATSTLGSIGSLDGGLTSDNAGNLYVVQGGGGSTFYKYSPSGNSWATLASAPTTAALVYPGTGNYIYDLAGSSGTGFSEYSISGNTWTSLASPVVSASAGAALSYDNAGNIYALMGYNSSYFYRYSISANTWTAMAATPYSISNGGALSYPGTGNYIYATLGNNSTYFYRYSISANTWTAMAAVPASVTYGGSLSYPGNGDYIYAAVGGGSAAFYAYSISNNNWSIMSNALAGFGLGGTIGYPGSGGYLYGLSGGNTANFYKFQLPTNNTVLPFSYTGSVQSWTVPAGVTSIIINANGAGEGGSGYNGGTGAGGSSTGTLTVVPGTTYYYNIGGAGNVNGTGGFGGGGAGGGTSIGAGGGGMTWFGTANTFSQGNSIIVAGGAGGSGNGNSNAAGVGGGTAGGNAGGGFYSTGGTQTGGGTPYGNGNIGLPGVGGAGGSGTAGGGGGGGGYYGGSGGCGNGGYGYPGAGGSGYISGSLTSASTTQGTGAAANTNGSLSISYSAPQSSYVSPGTYTSAPINVTENTWGTLSWANANGQTITMQARSATTSAGLSAKSWCTITNPGDTFSADGCISGGAMSNGDSYIQYQATLSTTNSAVTPSLDSVSITYYGVAPTGTLTSQPYNTIDPTSVIGEVDWNENIPTGTCTTAPCATVSLKTSADGSTWTGPYTFSDLPATGAVVTPVMSTISGHTNQTENSNSQGVVGTVFTSAVNGNITAIQFYKDPSETGTHIGKIWNVSNQTTPLASVTFTNETASGWQTQNLTTPLAITAGTQYMVSYGANSYFAWGYSNSLPITSGPLTLSASYSFPNPSMYPTNAFSNNNYGLTDVVFSYSSGTSNVSIPSSAIKTLYPSLQTSPGNKYWKYTVTENSSGSATPTVSSVSVKYVSPPTVALTYSKNSAATGLGTDVITATYNDLVSTPNISIAQQGSATMTPAAMSCSGTTVTVCTYNYTVNQANGGTNKDGLATVTLSAATNSSGIAAASPTNATFTIDTTPPTVALTYSANPAKAGTETITATYSEVVTTAPTMTITESGSTISTGAMTGTAPGTVFTYNYTVPSDHSKDGTASIGLSTVTDAAGNAAISGQTVITKAYTGTGPLSWQVPTGVTSINLSMNGASGNTAGAPGGASVGTMAVTPGTTYYFNVGGTNGYGGGGSTDYGSNSNGGGMTWFGTANTFSQASAIMVAGGGGGGGIQDGGGAGGGLTGAASASASGGSQSSSGANGTSNCDTSIPSGAGQGGFTGAGGGGGGYYGGGAGACDYMNYAGGGGGGSGYVSPSLTGALTTTGAGAAAGANGSLTISYAGAAPSFTIDTTGPTVALSYSANTVKAGTNAEIITATYSKPITSTPNISITQPGSATISNVAMTAGSGNTYTYNYTVVAANGSTYKDGTATVSLSSVLDSAGNSSATPTNTTFSIDTTAPTATITAICSVSGNGCTTAGQNASPQQAYKAKTISGTAADTGSGVGTVNVSIEDTTTSKWYSSGSFGSGTEVYAPATGTTTWSYNASTVPYVIGDTYLIHAQSVDQALNNSTVQSLTFVAANMPPTVSNVTVTPETPSGVITVNYGVTDIQVPSTTVSLFYQVDATLSGAVGAGDSSLTVSSGNHLPATGTIMIDNEMISYTAKSGNTLSGLTRGAGTPNTTPYAHSAGASIFVKATSATGAVGTVANGTNNTITWTAKNDANGFETASGVVEVVANDGASGSMIGLMPSSSFTLDASAPTVTYILNVSAGTINLSATDLSSPLTYLLQNGSSVTAGTTVSPGSAIAWTFGSETNKTVTALVTDPYGNNTTITAVAPAIPQNFQVKDLTNAQAQIYGEALSWSKVTDVSGSTAASYQIWRSDNGGAYTLLTTVLSPTNIYTDLTVVYTHKYAYKVLAVDTNGNMSGFSGNQSNTAGVSPTAPTITLNGANPMSVTKGTTFTDPGATATDVIDVTDPVTVTGTVDSNTVNTYTLTYSATDSSGLTSVATRTVNVILASTYNIVATTGANGTVTPSGTTAVISGANQTYNITPATGYAVATLTVDGVSLAPATTYTFSNVVVAHTIAATFKDVTPPVITLNGANPMSVTLGSTFTDPGATAFDAGDNAATIVTTTGTVNTAALGAYTLTYSSTDSSGNTSTATRTVNVVLSATYNIVATTGINGTISPSGTTAVVSGTNQTYIINANTGYAVATLTVDGVSLAPATTYTFTNVVATHTIAVTFKDITPPVITLIGANPMSVTLNSTFTDPGATAFDAADNLATTVNSSGTVNATALGAYTITYTSTDSSGNTATKTRTVNVVLASTYNIVATAGANGTISPSGTTAVPSGTNQMYTMIPSSGYSLATLAVDGVSLAPTSTYTFSNVVAVHTITVTFTKTAVAPTITLNGSNPMSVTKGTIFTDPGATATDVIDGDISGNIVVTGTVNTAAVGTYTLTYTVTDSNQLTTTKTRTVNVVLANTYTITASSDANGMISPSGSVSVNGGSNQIFTFTPNSGYHLNVLTVDGSPAVASGSTYTFSNVVATHTIAVTFTKTAVAPTITLNGSNPMSVTVGSTFTDPGATANDVIDGDISANIVVTGTVNTTAVGTYTLTYTVTDSSQLTTTKTRTVNVTLASTYNITATSDADGTIAPSGITAVVSGANQMYTMTPTSGYTIATLTVDGTNLAPATTYTFTNVVAAHTIAVAFAKIATPPVITLNGTNPMSVTVGSTFTDPGATATDAIDGTDPVTTTGKVDTTTVGSYTLTYSAKDSLGSVATPVTRTVNVVLAPTYTITASSDDNGTITPTGTNTTVGGITTVPSQTDQTYTITPNTGYYLASLVVDGTSLSTNGVTTYTFSSVAKNHTIAVTFTNVPFPTVGFDSSIDQGTENVGIANIPVSISSAYPNDVTVDYAVTGGTAVVGVDYTLNSSNGDNETGHCSLRGCAPPTSTINSGTLTIPAGQTSANISINITPTSVYGPTKTIILTLSNPSDATLGTNISNTYSILNDNSPVVNSSSNVKSTSAVVTWTTVTYSDSLVEYGTVDPGPDPTNPNTGAYNLSKHTDTATGVLNHSVYLANLTPSTEYFVRETSTDANGVATVNLSNFTTTAGPVITGTASSGITDTVAVITWTTDLPSSSYVNYSTDSGLATPTNSGTADLVTAHSVTLTGLTPLTQYYFSVDSTDANSNVSEDANGGTYYTFTTTADVNPPTITNITTPAITDTQAVVFWNTNKLADGKVMYGTTSCGTSTSCGYDNGTTLISIPLENHLAVISGLTQSTQYYYVVVSTSANGKTATSPEQTFTTAATSVIAVGGSSSVGVSQAIYDALLAQNQAYASKFGTDTSIPTVSNIQISNITAFGATISFSTSKDTIAFIDYGKDTTYGSLAADDTTGQTHTIVLDGLTLGTQYNFKIKALDLLNQAGYSDNQTFTTKFLVEAMSDAQKVDNAEQFQTEVDSTIQSILPSLVPPFVNTPAVSDITEDGATVTFSTNIKSFGVLDYTANYDVTKDDPYDGEMSDVATKTTDHTLVLKGLEPNTEYHVMAKAFSLPEVVGKSADFTFTTAASQIQPSIVDVGTDTFTAVWTTPNDPSSSIVEYRDIKSGITQKLVDDTPNTSHSVKIENLTSGTAYEVNVSGVNSIGNTVKGSAPVDVTTSVDVTPPVITDLKVDSSLIVGLTDAVQTIVSWTTDKPSTSAVYYAEGSGAPDAPLPNKQEDTDLTLNHTIILTSLKAGTVYRFTVESTDDAGNTIKPPVRTIVTPKATQSIMDIIFKNFDDTFKFVNNVK